MSKYAIWDKTSKVITPNGKLFTAAEWIEKYPVAAELDTVCGGGAVNGSFFAVYSSMKEMYAEQGVDFSSCTTQQECLDAIEAFEDAQNTSTTTDSNTRIADALEDLVVMNELSSSTES